MTILLSALPSAVTVGLVYAILEPYTSLKVRLVCCCLMLGSTIFLAEATILGYHNLAVMLIVLTYYLYDRHKTWAAITAGLAIGVHPISVPILGLWLLVRREVKPALIAAGVAAVCYSVIVILMWLPTPPLLAGKLSLHTLTQYFTQTSHAIVGQLSIFEAPKRLWLTTELLLLSFGPGIILLGYALRKPYSVLAVSHLSTIIFVLWYFFTCMDVMTWTYLTFAVPSAIILVGIGLTRASFHWKAVVCYGMLLVILNSTFMNANTLTNENPTARNYINELSQIPQDSIVVTTAGACSLGLFYYIASHDTNIEPLVYPYLEYPNYFPTEDYKSYLITKYRELNYNSTLTAIQDALEHNIPVYYPNYPETGPALTPCLILESSREGVVRVIGLTGREPKQ